MSAAMTSESQPLAVVVGRNCKAIRKLIGITQDELARYARDCGLRWKASTVADFEGARSAPTFATVVSLSIALQNAAQIATASGRTDISMSAATLDELVRFDGMIRLNDDVALPADFVTAICRGQTRPGWTSPPGAEPIGTLTLYRDIWGESSLTPPQRLLMRSGTAEERLARQLGIDPERLAGISYTLWQKTFSEERDSRAGPDANQQKKGRISRDLRAELEGELSHGHD